MVRSTRRVCPFLARYSSVLSNRRPISSSVASSISRNSIGTRSMVIVDSVTTAAAMRLIASMGSSEGKYSMSTSMSATPVTVSVVEPMPSIRTPRAWRKKHRSWTM